MGLFSVCSMHAQHICRPQQVSAFETTLETQRNADASVSVCSGNKVWLLVVLSPDSGLVRTTMSCQLQMMTCASAWSGLQIQDKSGWPQETLKSWD